LIQLNTFEGLSGKTALKRSRILIIETLRARLKNIKEV